MENWEHVTPGLKPLPTGLKCMPNQLLHQLETQLPLLPKKIMQYSEIWWPKTLPCIISYRFFAGRELTQRRQMGLLKPRFERYLPMLD